MFRIKPIRVLTATLLAPLALGLAACGDGDATGGNLSGDPIAKIAPPEGQAWSDIVEKTPEGGYRMGNPDAPIKLVEFASLTCPHCAHFSEESTPELREQFVDSGRVSYEFRNFILNPLDLTMAMIVRCGATESFFGLTEQVMSNQPELLGNWDSAPEAVKQQASDLQPPARFQAIAQAMKLQDFFAARGIAADQTKTCLADTGSAEKIVGMTSKQSEDYDITGTPTFLINGRKSEGNQWAPIKAELEKMGAR